MTIVAKLVVFWEQEAYKYGTYNYSQNYKMYLSGSTSDLIMSLTHLI